MLVLGAISIAVSVAFVTIGAWPVCGFFGLDVLLVYVAFRLSYRSARQRETLRLADEEFTVERVGIPRRAADLAVPAVLAARRLRGASGPVEPAVGDLARQELAIGTFLPAPVRRDVAVSLRDAFARWAGGAQPRSALGAHSPSTSFMP